MGSEGRKTQRATMRNGVHRGNGNTVTRREYEIVGEIGENRTKVGFLPIGKNDPLGRERYHAPAKHYYPNQFVVEV